MLFKSFRMNKILRPAAPAAQAAAYELVQKHKVTPGIPGWLNYMPGKVWGEITYPFLNFNGCTLKFRNG